MSAGSAPLVALLGFLSLCGTVASAHEAALSGVVLGTAGNGSVIVRHGALPGLAAGTSAFRIPVAADAKRLRPGVTFDATADTGVVPATLRDVRTVGSQSLTGTPDVAPDVLRAVHHLAVGEHVPQPAMVDQTGRPFRFRDYGGGPVVLAFIYTRCRDERECPLISAKFGALAHLPEASSAHLVLATIDPAFDTPSVLAKYAATFGADPHRWSFVTGDPETMLDFAAQFDVTAFPDQRVGLIHPERTVILDRFGNIRQLIDTTAWRPSEIAAAVAHESRLGSNPIERLDLFLSAAAVAVCGNGVAGFSGFTDLLTVIAIAAFFSFLLYRVGRAIARGET